MITTKLLKDSNWCYVKSILPLSAAILFSFLFLDSKSFWLDEAFSISFVSSSWSQLLGIISHGEANMTLYYVLLKMWIILFGDSEFVIRSLSAIFAIAGVLVTGSIAQRLFGARAAEISTLLLSLNAMFIQYAQEARGYTLALLLVSISYFILIQVIEKQGLNYYMAYGVVNSLVLYAHLFAIFALIAQMVSLFFIPPKRILWKRMLVSIFVTAFLTVPLFLLLLGCHSGQLDWVKKTTMTAPYHLILDFTGNDRKLLLCYAVAAATVSVCFVTKFCQLKRNIVVWRHVLPICWLVVPVLSVYFMSLAKPVFVNRYMFFCLPGFVLLAGAGISVIRHNISLWLFTALMVVLSLQSVVYTYYPKKKEDWRSATDYVLSNTKKGDAILFYSRASIVPFQYYYKRRKHDNVNLASVYPSPLGTTSFEEILRADPSPSVKLIDSLSEKYDRLWVVLSHDNVQGRDSKPIIQVIEGRYINKLNASFEKIVVKLYQVRNDLHGGLNEAPHNAGLAL